MTKRWIVFFSYLLLAIVFVLPVWFRFPQYYIGHGEDPFIMMWMLRWMSYAIAHHINPLFCHFIWVPFGANLMVTTNIPLLALLAWPITQISALLSYNFLLTIAMPVSAFAMYILSRYLVKNNIAAWCAGLVYGFSTYQLVHLQSGHVNLVWSFCLPLIALQCLRFYRSAISAAYFSWSLIVLLLVQFLISKEVFLIINFMMVLAFIVNLFVERNFRQSWTLIKSICVVYGVTLLLLLPFLYFYTNAQVAMYHPANLFEISLANYMLPTRLTYLGAGLMQHWQLDYGKAISENTGYLGIPLILLLVFMMFRFYKKRAILFLSILFLISAILSLGPLFRLFAKSFFHMPSAFVYHLPSFHYVLPARFMLLVFFFASLLLLYFLQLAIPKVVRLITMLLIVLFLFPNVNAIWYQKTNHLQVFSKQQLERFIPNGSRVLVLDQSSNLIGRIMLQQLDAHASFKLSNGHIGPGVYPFFTAIAFQQPQLIHRAGQFFKIYLQKSHTNIVMLAKNEMPIFKGILSGLQYREKQVSNVLILYLINFKQSA